MDLHELVSKIKELANDIGKTPTVREFEASGISKRQIVKHGYNNIVRAAGLEINKSPHDFEGIEIESKPPRILFLDIETAPINVYTWGLFDQNIPLSQINEDWFILAYSAKFNDEHGMHYLDQRYAKPTSDDRQLLEGVHHLMKQSDWICGHNVARFDLKKINARFIKHGLEPLDHYRVIDTLKIARKNFAFTSNKLEYLAHYLECDHKKLTHSKFPGSTLFIEASKGNQEAFLEMESYNTTDVIVLIEVFNKLARYDNSINFSSHYGKTVCTCGNDKFAKDGLRFTKNGRFQAYRCIDCGRTFRDKENLLLKDLRKGLYV